MSPGPRDEDRHAPTPGVGVVAAGHDETVVAAAHCLGAGGNAFDAAIAAGFTAAVVEPTLTSLGGGGFLLARTAAGEERVFDFFVDTPGRGLSASALEPHFHPVTVHFPDADQVFNTGYASAAVPGNLRGYLHVHERLGSLALDTIVAHACAVARSGIRLNANQAYVIELLEPILTATAPSRALFAPRGHRLRAGDVFRNPDIADFIEALSAGAADSLYGGDIAAYVDSDMRAGDGLLTRADLAEYEVIERDPLAVEYRGNRIITNPPPSFGGSLLALSLEVQDKQLASGAAAWGTGRYLRNLADVQIEVDRLRASPKGPQVSRGTTHISVSDGRGNYASLTTSNGEASGYVVPGTGIMLNNMMGEDDLHPAGFHAHEPGVRVASMMSPSIVADADGVSLVAGSGGSKRIRTTMLQVISHVVDQRLGVRGAVDAPRLHWDGDCCQVEPGFGRDALDELATYLPINEWSERNMYFGGAHALDPAGVAAGDPRRGGVGVVVEV